MRYSVILIGMLSILLSGCARMTAKTHQDDGEECTQTNGAPLVDVVTTIPLFGYAGLLTYVGVGVGLGPLVLVIAAPLAAAGTYTSMSAIYGIKEIQKCREIIDGRRAPKE